MVSEDQSQGPENSRASTISTMLGPPKRLAPLPNVIVVVAHFFLRRKGSRVWGEAFGFTEFRFLESCSKRPPLVDYFSLFCR